MIDEDGHKHMYPHEQPFMCAHTGTIHKYNVHVNEYLQ